MIDKVSLAKTDSAADIVVRAVAEDQWEPLVRAMSVPYGFDPTPERMERFRHAFDLSRLRAAFDAQQIVGTFGSLDLELTIPGGMLTTSGVTVVSVLPTHRRRGILRKMMAQHLAELHENGYALAALWASETAIYGRFGFGPASQRALMKLEKSSARLLPADSSQDGDTGQMRLVDVSEALQVFPAIYDKVACQCPGMFRRRTDWWEHRFLADLEFFREGATEHRRAVYLRRGQPAGYVVFRTKSDSHRRLGELRVVELLGTDRNSQQALWRFLFGVDLIESITYWNQPIDDPLLWWVPEPRRIQRQIEDALWVRTVDVTGALLARQYACGGRVVLRMHDPLCPWNQGVFQLEVDETGDALYLPSRAAAQVELTPCALGAVYLGGRRFCELAQAGVITGDPAALRQLDRMFACDRLPWCQEIF